MLFRAMVCVVCLGLVNVSMAVTTEIPARSAQEVQHIQELLQQMVDVNLRYKDKFHSKLTSSTLEQQTPHATLVMCSDSRVDMDILTDTPTGEMFVVRNIGNQLSTAYGSVEYGVEHLNTQLLLVVGHSGCGAVKAAMQDYTDQSIDLQKELGTLQVDPKATLNQNLVQNVNHQVTEAADLFKARMDAGTVVIIGMIYDMHNDFGYGNGQLILVNINTATDPKVLAANQYIKGLKHLKIYTKD